MDREHDSNHEPSSDSPDATVTLSSGGGVIVKRKRTNQRSPRREATPAALDMSEERLAKLLGDAHASGLFAGMDHPLFNVRGKNKPPISCMATVYRLCGGRRRKFTASAAFDEFSDDTPAWRKRPYHELSRCALILALTYGFTVKPYEDFEDEE